MPSFRTRVPRLMVAVVALAVLCTGCGGFKPTVEPNATDDARLEALVAESVLAGGTAAEAHSPDTSANVTVQRGSVVVSDPWANGATDEAASGDDSTLPDPTWAAARSMLATLREAGWEPIAVSCELEQSGALGEATVSATKDLGDFTAALESRISATDSSLAGYAPFHTEDPDPWTPSAAIAPGASCLDGEAPPADDVAPPDDLNVARWF